MEHLLIASPHTDSDPTSEETRDTMGPLFGVGGQFTGVDAADVDFGMVVDQGGALVKVVDEEGDAVVVLEKEGKKDAVVLVGNESDGKSSKGPDTVDLDLRVDLDDTIKETEGVGGIVSTLEQDGKGENSDDGLDPLFGVGGRFTGVGTAYPYFGMKVDGLLKEPNEEENGVTWLEKVGKNNKKKKSEKRSEREGDDDWNIGRKKKKKKAIDGKAAESARKKRKHEKEKTVYVKQLHAESQRILRETRDVSFKPLPHVQKPITSVLEKIRLRKMEMLKKIGNSDASNISFDTNASDESHSEASDNLELDKNVPCPGNVAIATSDIPETLLDSNENTRDDDYSTRDFPGGDEITQSKKKTDSSPEVLALASHETPAKPDSDQTDYISSDGGDSFKENIDPLKKDKNANLYKNAALKVFVDDEAEEEDDSDHDLMRFQDNDDESESEWSESLNDMIATGFEEMPVDQKRRNELHQKWLEKIDADETDNVLQRINNCVRQREPAILQDVEEDLDENSGEDSNKDIPDAPVSENEPPAKAKLAKDMIATMFDDKDDGFVSSDDEESERRLLRQNLLEKAGFRSSILSPEVDDKSKEVFSLIKKLNNPHDPKKRSKAAATRSYEGLLKVENTNSNSKSSFLGRLNSNSLPSLKKKGGGNTFKSFVFGRDDSNSRSAISASESFSDMQSGKKEKEKQCPAKTSSKISKVKSVSPMMKSRKSESSLFEILQRSSLQFDEQRRNQSESPTMVSEIQTIRYLTTLTVQNKTIRK